MSVDELLGLETRAAARPGVAAESALSFSLIFFSDVRAQVSDAEKYAFMKELTVFGDRAGLTAVYMPERHFGEFGSIYANPAITAAYLIPHTERIRFRTAGIVLALHHPAEIVEWWAMNDILSNGRVDLGFASGWNRPDFIYAPGEYEDRKNVTRTKLQQVQRLWRGETLQFPGPGRDLIDVKVQPQPVQRDVQVWMLTLNSDEGFKYAGANGLNIFTMLQGRSLEDLGKSIALYRAERRQAGLDPAGGVISLMLHTLVGPDTRWVSAAVEQPFKEYIRSSMESHLQAMSAHGSAGAAAMSERDKRQMLDFAYHRYFSTASLLGALEDVSCTVERARAAGVNEIALLMDFGVDYEVVRKSLPYLRQLIQKYGYGV